jgi:hypothetical protein
MRGDNILVLQQVLDLANINDTMKGAFDFHRLLPA